MFLAGFGAGTPQQEAVPKWREFSRIENLWPRDGSCPLPLRSKCIFDECFRIVKAQKISRGYAAHVRGSPFAPNEVPAPVCAAALSGSPTQSVRSWRSISFRRLMQDSRFSMKKAGRSADTAFCFFQAQEWHFEVVRSTTVNKIRRFVQPHKVLFVKKYRPRSAAMDFVGWNSGKMNRVCCGAVNSFVDFPSLKWWVSRW